MKNPKKHIIPVSNRELGTTLLWCGDTRTASAAGLRFTGTAGGVNDTNFWPFPISEATNFHLQKLIIHSVSRTRKPSLFPGFQILRMQISRLKCIVDHTCVNGSGFTHTYLVCNYGRAGNVISTPMYTSGPACSACPQGSSCTSQGLCR